MYRTAGLILAATVFVAYGLPSHMAAHSASRSAGVIAKANAVCHSMQKQLTQAALKPDHPDFIPPRPSRAELAADGAALARYDLPIFRKGLAKLDALGEPPSKRVAWDRFRHAFHTWLSAFARQIRAMRAGNLGAYNTAEQRAAELARPLGTYARAAGATSCALS